MNQSTGCSEENSKYVHVIKKIYMFFEKITSINLADNCLGFHTWMAWFWLAFSMVLWFCELMVPSIPGTGLEVPGELWCIWSPLGNVASGCRS